MTDLKTKLEALSAEAWNAWHSNTETHYAKKHMELAFLAGFKEGHRTGDLIALPAEPDAAMVERVARAVDGTYDVKPDGDMTNLTDVATAACRAVLDQLREAGRG